MEKSGQRIGELLGVKQSGKTLSTASRLGLSAPAVCDDKFKLVVLCILSSATAVRLPYCPGTGRAGRTIQILEVVVQFGTEYQEWRDDAREEKKRKMCVFMYGSMLYISPCAGARSSVGDFPR